MIATQEALLRNKMFALLLPRGWTGGKCHLWVGRFWEGRGVWRGRRRAAWWEQLSNLGVWGR